MKNETITMPDGRTVGFADYGAPPQIPVVWCHGGPGSRREPSFVADAAARAGIRLIGIDRPGYGRSTPQPGRTIGGWVPDALAVADHLGVEQFAVIGLSTGGAYALALAASSPRVIGAVACCAVSDMRWAEGKAMNVCCHAMWNARSRSEAEAITIEQFGARGENILPPKGPTGFDPADTAFFESPAVMSWWIDYAADMFTHGPAGFVDDRFADANGWGTFDVARITCPVTVLHGSLDGLMPVENAHHTASIVAGARLRIVDGLGHISIITKSVEALSDVLQRAAAGV